MKKKYRLRPSIKIILIILLILINSFLLSKVIARFNKPKEPEVIVLPTDENEDEKENEPTIDQGPKTYSASLFMMGDALVQIDNSSDARKEDGTYDWSSQMDGITKLANNYDLAYYNQEVILGGDELGITIFPNLNADYSFGDYMVSKGFNLVSTSNNHALDKGEQGIINSLKYWNSKSDVVHAGTYLSYEEQNIIPIHEVNGITYAFNSWTYGTNFNLPEGKEYLVNVYRDNEDKMLEWVKEADKKADVVIIAMHWGNEFTYDPTGEQYRLSEQLVEAGADIIIGNHAHSVQPITYINNSIVYYALGNCINAQSVPDYSSFEQVNTGLISTLNIVKTIDGDNTTIEIKDVKADLLLTYNTEDYTHMYSVMYNDLTDDILPNRNEYYNWLVDNVVHRHTNLIKMGL